MTFSYCLLDTPIPLFNYVAHIRLLPVTDGNRSFWHWESRFTTPPGREAELARDRRRRCLCRRHRGGAPTPALATIAKGRLLTMPLDVRVATSMAEAAEPAGLGSSEPNCCQRRHAGDARRERGTYPRTARCCASPTRRYRRIATLRRPRSNRRRRDDGHGARTTASSTFLHAAARSIGGPALRNVAPWAATSSPRHPTAISPWRSSRSTHRSPCRRAMAAAGPRRSRSSSAARERGGQGS